MNKFFLITTLFLFSALFANAQDFIFLKDNSSIKVKVKDIDSGYIIYSKFDSPIQEMCSLKVEDVRFILYENGSKWFASENTNDKSGQNFNNGVESNTSNSSIAAPVQAITQTSAINIEQMRVEYRRARGLRNAGIIITSVGIAGGILAIAGSTMELEGMYIPSYVIGLACLCTGIPMWAVGGHKAKNRRQYVSCVSKELDFGKYALTPSVGFTKDMDTNTNIPSVGLAFRF